MGQDKRDKVGPLPVEPGSSDAFAWDEPGLSYQPSGGSARLVPEAVGGPTATSGHLAPPAYRPPTIPVRPGAAQPRLDEVGRAVSAVPAAPTPPGGHTVHQIAASAVPAFGPLEGSRDVTPVITEAPSIETSAPGLHGVGSRADRAATFSRPHPRSVVAIRGSRGAVAVLRASGVIATAPFAEDKTANAVPRHPMQVVRVAGLEGPLPAGGGATPDGAPILATAGATAKVERPDSLPDSPAFTRRPARAQAGKAVRRPLLARERHPPRLRRAPRLRQAIRVGPTSPAIDAVRQAETRREKEEKGPKVAPAPGGRPGSSRTRAVAAPSDIRDMVAPPTRRVPAPTETVLAGVA